MTGGNNAPGCFFNIMNEEEVMKMAFDLNTHVHRLLCDEPFFAALSRRIDKRSSTAIPTAGVRVNPSNARY